VDLHTDRPHPARVYNYLLGGDVYFDADRDAAEQGIKSNPHSRVPPRENRAFLRRDSAQPMLKDTKNYYRQDFCRSRRK